MGPKGTVSFVELANLYRLSGR